MKLMFFVLLYFMSFYCWADVFKSVDSQGNVVYSDTPLNDHAERMELPQDDQTETSSEESTISTKAVVTETKDTASTTTKEKKPYTKFLILSPTDQATLQNQPTIQIEIGIDPLLQEGDKIQIYLDGRPWGSPAASTHFEFVKPDRGTHQISAKLMDDHQMVIKETGSNTIYIHQAHIGTSPPG